MPDYRLYWLDKSGHILQRHEFQAADDKEALAAAHSREHPLLDCEVWELARKVAVIPAKAIAKARP